MIGAPLWKERIPVHLFFPCMRIGIPTCRATFLQLRCARLPRSASDAFFFFRFRAARSPVTSGIGRLRGANGSHSVFPLRGVRRLSRVLRLLECFFRGKVLLRDRFRATRPFPFFPSFFTDQRSVLLLPLVHRAPSWPVRRVRHALVPPFEPSRQFRAATTICSSLRDSLFPVELRAFYDIEARRLLRLLPSVR